MNYIKDTQSFLIETEQSHLSELLSQLYSYQYDGKWETFSLGKMQHRLRSVQDVKWKVSLFANAFNVNSIKTPQNVFS